MARAVAEYNWNNTPLGPIDQWPVSLRIAVDMMLNSSFPKCIVWGAGLTTIYNDAFKPILGSKPEALGRSFSDVWLEAWDEIGPICTRAFLGEATFIEDFPLTVYRNGFEEKAYFTFCYSPIFDETGTITGMIDTVVETTSTVMAREQMAVANAELAHRMKNMIAMITAIANSTLKNSPDLDAARVTLTERLRAMAQSQDVLTRGIRGDASIRDIVETTTLPYLDDPAQMTISGPEIHLARKQSLALSLAIHELFTNATKHGALSCSSGRVAVSWETLGEQFTFRWVESGGPLVSEPARRGFGSTLIEKIVSHEFSGEAALTFRSSGLEYTINSPVETLLAYLDREHELDESAETQGEA